MRLTPVDIIFLFHCQYPLWVPFMYPSIKWFAWMIHIVTWYKFHDVPQLTTKFISWHLDSLNLKFSTFILTTSSIVFGIGNGSRHWVGIHLLTHTLKLRFKICNLTMLWEDPRYHLCCCLAFMGYKHSVIRGQN